MEVGRILPTEAAVILNVSPQFIRIAMQRRETPYRNSGADVINMELITFRRNCLQIIPEKTYRQNLRESEEREERDIYVKG